MPEAMTTTPTQSGSLKSTKQAADYLGVSERTIWSLANSSRIPVIRIGTRVLFKLADLDSFIDQNRSRGPAK